MQTNDLTHEQRNEHAKPTIGEVLLADVDVFLADLRANSLVLERTKSGALSPVVVAHHLRSLHYLIQNTMQHLSVAEESARSRGQESLARHFAQKKAEEQGHDRWAEADMKRLAGSFGTVIPAEPTPEMRAIVASNSCIVRDDPYLYLVYMFFAEYLTVAVGPEWLRTLADKCGIPASFVTVIDKHVELDQHHASEGCEAIDAFFDGRPHGAVRDALQAMMGRFADYCDGLCAVPQ